MEDMPKVHFLIDTRHEKGYDFLKRTGYLTGNLTGYT